MKKPELENMRKLKLSEVIKEKGNLEVLLVKEIARLASQGKKSSNTLRQIKRKIAWSETVISQILAQTLNNNEVKNG
jgi:ribosomal protein L29